MCLHLYSTVCPVVCDHLRIDVTVLSNYRSSTAQARGPRNGPALNPDVTLGARGCPVLPGRAAELVRIAHVYENLVPACANKNSSKQRARALAHAPVRRPGDGGRSAHAAVWPSVFSSQLTRQFVPAPSSYVLRALRPTPSLE